MDLNHILLFEIKAIASANNKIKSLANLLDCSDTDRISKTSLHHYFDVIIDASKKASVHTAKLLHNLTNNKEIFQKN